VFSVERLADTIVITPQCDLDLASRDAFINTLEQALESAGTRIVVSLLECTYLDSSALSALVLMRRKFKGSLLLVVPPDVAIARVFEVTNFSAVIPIFPTLDAAMVARSSASDD